jgi:hypothetical protein
MELVLVTPSGKHIALISRACNWGWDPHYVLHAEHSQLLDLTSGWSLVRQPASDELKVLCTLGTCEHGNLWCDPALN